MVLPRLLRHRGEVVRDTSGDPGTEFVPGRVNRLLSRWAKGIYLQFRNARDKFINNPGEVL